MEIKNKDYIEEFIQSCRDQSKISQDVFDGLDPRFTHAAYDSDGQIFAYCGKPMCNPTSGHWTNIRNNMLLEDRGYITVVGNWTQSLIERIN